VTDTPSIGLRSDSELGSLRFSPGTEEWVEFGAADARRRVGFHDYGAIYAVPGLYEAMFYERLGMRSTFEVVRLFAQALERAGLSAGEQRVIDFGAGNGLGGERLRELGVGALAGVDIEPMARVAAQRDRPGVYDRYLVGDLGAWDETQLGELISFNPTALLALSAIGLGHVPPAVLDRAIRSLPADAIYGFGLHPRLLPGTDDPAGLASGFPEFMDALLADSEVLCRTAYVHRVRPDGSDDLAVAFIGRLKRR
jgi:hypothetical protein